MSTSQRVEGPERPFKCASAVTKNRRVAVTATGIQHAGASAAGVGVASRDGAVGEVVAVRLFSAGGTHNFVAGNTTAIAAGAALKGFADGKVAVDGAGVDLNFVSLGPTTAAVDDAIEATREG